MTTGADEEIMVEEEIGIQKNVYSLTAAS